MGAIITFLLVFGLLVFVHEFGHFAAARFFKVKVDEFAFGFPPKIWSKKKGDTVYAINLIPIGGYVKLAGEDGEGDKNDKNSFLSKKPWQKVIILGSGVIMNFLLAYLLLTGFYLFGGKPLLPDMWKHNFTENTQKVSITEVVKDSPAEKVGLKGGDVIRKVEGNSVYNTQEVFSIIQSKIKNNERTDIKVLIFDGTKEIEKTVSTYSDTFESDGKKIEYQRIGIVTAEDGKVKAKWYAAPLVAAEELVRITKLTVVGLGGFFATLFTEFKLSEDVGGPVAIFMTTSAAATIGFSAVVQVVIILSSTLAIVNIMPFPALDGGHIFFLLVEKISGREISKKIKESANTIGFFLLLLLIVFVTYKDVLRFEIFDGIKGIFR